MNNDQYAAYVEHPRYGRGPIYTGIDPDPNDPDVYLHPGIGICSDAAKAFISTLRSTLGLRQQSSSAIPGTAIVADTSKQISRPVSITHYYDRDCVCRKCGRPFIFFALEQKYWYEELRFPPEANCVCCTDCRMADRNIVRQRKRYENLCHTDNPTTAEMLEMANCCLTLIEEGLFSNRQTEHVRAIINHIPPDQQVSKNFEELVRRLHTIENQLSN